MVLADLLMSPRGLALDKYLVRYTGHSLLIHVFAHKAALEPQPALLLRSRGRHSGTWRSAVLPCFFHRGEMVVVGSSGGLPQDPQWVQNLRVQAQAEVFLQRQLRQVTARFAQGSEYEQLWSQISSAVPVYRDYQQQCVQTRQIPLVILSTQGSGGPLD